MDFGDQVFRRKVLRDLKLISETTSGRAMLESIAKTGKKINIIRTVHDVKATPISQPGVFQPGFLRQPAGTPGPVADVIVRYNPDLTDLKWAPHPYDTAPWGREPNCPPDVFLFHEMVHADDFMHGTADNSHAPNQPRPRGESRAVGFIGTSPFSENKYRAEKNLLPRLFP